MNAIERGQQLLTTKVRDVPTLAIKFANHLGREAGGGCIEVYLTAFAVYAHCAENLPCDDELYTARPQDVEWFKLEQLAAGVQS